jgi:hypothetical protein
VVIEVLKEVTVQPLLNIICGFKALQLKELDRKDVLVPIFYASNPGQFLKFIGDR